MGKRINVRISDALYEKLVNDAHALECSVNALINMKLLNAYGYIENPLCAGKHCANIQQLTLCTGIDNDNVIRGQRVQGNSDGQRAVDRGAEYSAADTSRGSSGRVEDSRLMCGDRWLSKGIPWQ